MRCRYAPTCRGLRVLNRAQHLMVTSLIMGLAAAAPNRPAPGSVPGKQCTSYDSNALVTRALHYLLSSAMLPQIVHCPRTTSSRADRSHRYLFSKPPTPVSMSMPPRNGRQFNRGRGRGDLLCTQNHRKTEKRKLTLS